MKQIIATLLLTVFLAGLITPAIADITYVGSITSKRYHLTSCGYIKRIESKNRIIFKSKQETEKRGYIPCKVCKP